MSSQRRNKAVPLSSFIEDKGTGNQSRNEDRKKEICHFFAQGNCKFGDRCNFAHIRTSSVINNGSISKKESKNEHLRFGNLEDSQPRQNQTLPRERGRIQSVSEDKGFGFIISNNKQRIFYHISDVEGHEVLKEKDEVEFSITRDKIRKDDIKAINIKLLGRVHETKQPTSNKLADEGKKLNDEFPQFMPAWMKLSQKPKETSISQKPADFDSSTISLAPQKPQVRTIIRNEELLKGIEILPREKGTVQTVRDNFGFIKPYSKSELVFYHINEVEDRQQFQEGDEVEFTLVPDDRTNGKDLKATGVKLVRSSNLFGEQLEDHRNSNAAEKMKSLFQDKRNVLDWIKNMSEKDGEMLLLYTDQLDALVNQEELPFSVIPPLISLLTNPSIRSSDRTDRIYDTVLKSKFFKNPRNLRSYILKLSQESNKKGVITEFESVVDLLSEIMDRIPQTSTSDLPIDTISLASQKLQDNITTRITEKIARLNQHKEVKKTQTAYNFKTSEWSPGEGDFEDFRNISVFPTTEEIFSVARGEISKRVRPNIINGKYKNVMHYLDTHFRLLREDCLQPLREGIRSFLETKSSAATKDIKVYRNVVMKGMQCSRSGIVYRVSFELDGEIAWERSKRLIYGSLLCLSCDEFKTLLWATVSNRDPVLLTTNREIDIRFPNGYESSFSHERTYTMVESSATYFEAYQHVLRALQQLDIDNLPFSQYLINCEPNVKSPPYLRTRDAYDMQNIFDDGKTTFPILKEWPTTELKTTLDDSQMAALKHALTKELAIIQGPPGTGKTFVGLKVIRALLDNTSFRQNSPILVVCYTNHALDQFLEGVLGFEDSIVRIGSRSKSEVLKDKNLRKLIQEFGKTGKQHYRARQDMFQQLDGLQEEILQAASNLNKRSLSLVHLTSIAKPAQIKNLIDNRKQYTKSDGDILEIWLNETTTQSKPKRKSRDIPYNGTSTRLDLEEEEEEEFDDETILRMQFDRMVDEDEDSSNAMISFKEDLIINPQDIEIPQDIVNVENLWELNRGDRHRLYRYWLSMFVLKEQQKNPLFELCAKYEELCKERKMIEEEMQIEVLKTCKVIGMTTTGVAKFQRLISEIKPEVIIVEECGETLESSLLPTFTDATKHLILIGDHEQLRPSTAVYKLSKDFNLDISLFERLVRNGVEQVTLLRQRRMRPTISSLIHPIYPNLEDHEYVKGYPNVMGLASNLYFLHHTFDESRVDESSSKCNEHEANLLARLSKYLTLQGYKSEQITVLSAYSGQVHLLRKEFRKLDLGAIRITSIDNFQGEESDIILLSLVRSNKQGEIGFLSRSNRVCVAISRAKIGMICIGNATCLQKKNDLWKKIIDNLKNQGCLGSSLKLQCQNHPDKVTSISVADDFKNVEDGGCNAYCNQPLECGHVCPRFCHPYSHEQLQCFKPCQRKHEKCGHPCSKRCFENCDPCEILVEKEIPACKHKEKMPCYLPPEDYICTQPCKRLLKCKEHTCPNMCGQRCAHFCHAFTKRLLSCGHVVTMECGQDKSKFKCNAPCDTILECGHQCSGNCSFCHGGKHKPCLDCLPVNK